MVSSRGGVYKDGHGRGTDDHGRHCDTLLGMGKNRRGQVGKRYHKPGTSPGTLLPLETVPGAGPPKVTVIDYGSDHFEERQVARIEEVFPYLNKPTVTWINVDGLHDVALLEAL